MGRLADAQAGQSQLPLNQTTAHTRRGLIPDLADAVPLDPAAGPIDLATPTSRPRRRPFLYTRDRSRRQPVGCFGLRLQGDTNINGVRLQTHLLANLWHGFQGTGTTVFNSVIALPAAFESTSLEVGVGIVAGIADGFGVYAQGSYTKNVRGDFREGFKGTLGMRVTWYSFLHEAGLNAPRP